MLVVTNKTQGSLFTSLNLISYLDMLNLSLQSDVDQIGSWIGKHFQIPDTHKTFLLPANQRQPCQHEVALFR